MLRRLFPLLVLGLLSGQAFAHSGVLGALTGLGSAEETEPGGDAALRPEMLERLQAVQQLLRQYKFAEALESMRLIAAQSDLRPNETNILTLLRVMAAAGADDPEQAAAAYAQAETAQLLTPLRRRDFADDITGAYYRRHDYPNAVFWGKRYVADGGSESRVLALLAHALYQTNALAEAEDIAAAVTSSEEKAGRSTPEALWQVLANSALKQNHRPQAMAALEKLVALYPRAAYWAVLVRLVTTQPGFPPALSLDAGRLRLALGLLDHPEDVRELAQQALHAGFPAEAKHILEAAPQVQDATLRGKADKQAEEERRSWPSLLAEAKRSGKAPAQLATGWEGVCLGQTEEGLALMEQALAQNPTSPNGWLHFGQAALAAGAVEKAKASFQRASEGSTPEAQLARLWILKLAS